MQAILWLNFLFCVEPSFVLLKQKGFHILGLDYDPLLDVFLSILAITTDTNDPELGQTSQIMDTVLDKTVVTLDTSTTWKDIQVT